MTWNKNGVLKARLSELSDVNAHILVTISGGVMLPNVNFRFLPHPAISSIPSISSLVELTATSLKKLNLSSPLTFKVKVRGLLLSWVVNGFEQDTNHWRSVVDEYLLRRPRLSVNTCLPPGTLATRTVFVVPKINDKLN